MRSIFRSTALLLCAGFAAGANAQATRTWVSGVGDDVNPCSRTAPCKTYAGAISKTAAKGEISILDPGDFGAVTITKAMTINGGYGSIGYLLNTSGSGITVNAGSSDIVMLKNLNIDGGNSGSNGIRYINGAQLVMENVLVVNEVTGISVEPSSVALNLAARNVSISASNTAFAGINVTSGGAGANVELKNISISGFATGIVLNGGVLDISESLITQNSGDALKIVDGKASSVLNIITNNGTALETAGSTAILSADHNTLVGNGAAVLATAGTIRVNDNTIYDNKTGISCGASTPYGTVVSTGTNRKANNVGGTYPVCPSVGTINQQ